MPVDPLSDVLARLKPRNHMSAGFDAGGDWSIVFPDQENSIKTGAVISGGCWLAVEGVADAVRLEAGDCFILPSGRPFRLARDLRLPPQTACEVFRAARDGGVVTHNGGGDTFLISSRFALDPEHAALLLRMLPPIVRLRDAPEQAALHWSVERMMHELRHPQPGGFLVVQHLAQMMLVQALRRYLRDTPEGVGWLFALNDRRMMAAIGAIHADPAHRWTLGELAARAGMSRSSFAAKFKAAVGATPIDYLTRWRMLLAADRLAAARDPVAVIAVSLGYESESAFSTAFKRVMGCAPRRYGGRSATGKDAEASLPEAVHAGSRRS